MIYGHGVLITLSEVIWIGIMLIPLIIFAVRYAHARNAVMQRCFTCASQREQYFRKAFGSPFERDNEELNKKWDEKLANIPGWQKTLCIYSNSNDYRKFVKETMIWKEKNQNTVGVKISGSIFRVFGLNIFLFGAILYPLAVQACSEMMIAVGIGSSGPTTDVMAIFTLLFSIIIIRRIIRLHKSTLYHKEQLKTISNLEDDPPEMYNVLENSCTTAWNRRGYYIQKICDKYFSGSEKALLEYAGNPKNIEKQRLNLAQRIIDDIISPWYRKPIIDKYEEDEDDVIGFCDTENLLLYMFFIILIMMILGVIIYLGIFVNIFGIFFDFIDGILHLGSGG